jgi:hypothetical protein
MTLMKRAKSDGEAFMRFKKRAKSDGEAFMRLKKRAKSDREAFMRLKKRAKSDGEAFIGLIGRAKSDIGRPMNEHADAMSYRNRLLRRMALVSCDIVHAKDVMLRGFGDETEGLSLSRRPKSETRCRLSVFTGRLSRITAFLSFSRALVSHMTLRKRLMILLVSVIHLAMTRGPRLKRHAAARFALIAGVESDYRAGMSVGGRLISQGRLALSLMDGCLDSAVGVLGGVTPLAWR